MELINKALLTVRVVHSVPLELFDLFGLALGCKHTTFQFSLLLFKCEGLTRCIVIVVRVPASLDWLIVVLVPMHAGVLIPIRRLKLSFEQNPSGFASEVVRLT